MIFNVYPAPATILTDAAEIARLRRRLFDLDTLSDAQITPAALHESAAIWSVLPAAVLREVIDEIDAFFAAAGR